MFERILLAVDESGPSRRAVGVAAGLAETFQGEVVVVEVPLHPNGPSRAWELSSEALGGEPPLIDRVVMELKDRGVSARPELWAAVVDDLHGSIADIAVHENVDIIVLGAREASEFSPDGETLADRLRILTQLPVTLVP